VSSAHVVPLLDGEDPQTLHASDARHWVMIYGQLVAFKKKLLRRINSSLGEMEKVAQTEALSDASALHEQLNRYLSRLDFWRSRQWLLQGVTLDANKRVLDYHGETLELTKREMQLLAAFAASPNMYLTAEHLLLHAWHDTQLAPDEVRIYLGRLRRKLRSIGMADIICRPRKGYRLSFRDDETRRANAAP
jgi:DNA-binding response OmpR family regulator